MHSLSFADVPDEEHQQFDFLVPHHVHSSYDHAWTPVDPALYNVQVEHHQKQFTNEFIPFQHPPTSYRINPTHGFKERGHPGPLSSWAPNIDTYRNMRYDSPGGHFGGTLSETSSDYPVSPELARQHNGFSPNRYRSPPDDSQISQQSWASSQSFVVASVLTPVSVLTPLISMSEPEFQEITEYRLDLQEDDLRTQLPLNAPEELELSDNIATLTPSNREGTDSSVSSPAHDHDSDSDFDPRRKSPKPNSTHRHLPIRTPRRPSSSSHPTLDTNGRIHKSANIRSSTSKDKSKPKPLPQLNAGSDGGSNKNMVKSFPCAFHIFGCPATFGNKNEWKRHVTSQHLQLGFYRCDLGGCNPENNSFQQIHRPHGLGQGSKSRGQTKRKSNTTSHCSQEEDSDEFRIYNDFNRKDLFTQHCRRMHGPGRHLLDSTTRTNQSINARLRAQGRKNNSSSNGKGLTSKEDEAAFEMELEEIRARCWTPRRRAPSRSSCGFCGKLFEASAHTSIAGEPDGKAEERAWEERMEHLGRHYDRDGFLPSMENADPHLLKWGLDEGILIEIKDVGAWLDGYELSRAGSQHHDDDGNLEQRREGLRKRGPRRKSSTTVKIEEAHRTIVKQEFNDQDAMAEDY